MYYALCRIKRNCFIMRQTSRVIKYSYAQIPLSEQQFKHALEQAFWVELQNYESNKIEWQLREEDDPKNFKRFYTRFFEVVKEHKECIEAVPIKTVQSKVIGTSRLVRSSDKCVIYIARRKKKKSGEFDNKTSINSVCIDDTHREMFFMDSRHCNGIPKPGEHYCICDGDGAYFTNWSEYLDKEYWRQVDES